MEMTAAQHIALSRANERIRVRKRDVGIQIKELTDNYEGTPDDIRLWSRLQGMMEGLAMAQKALQEV